jgi:hypothetical protein
VLFATELLERGEREQALAVVPWHSEARALNGKAFGALRDATADLIDIAIGTVHARAAMVSLQEGTDALLQTALDLVESKAAELYFARVEPVDPLGLGEPLPPKEDEGRVARRLVRVRIEDAAIRLSAAGNHLMNAYLRIAWEANAAGIEEVRSCGFDPESNRFDNWADVDSVARGLKKVATQPLAVLSGFQLTSAVEDYLGDHDVTEARWLRHRIVHRDRPDYRDAPAIGRKSLWTGTDFKITFPRREEPEGQGPSLAETRDLLARGGVATLRLAAETWETGVLLLRSVGVEITHQPREVKIAAGLDPGRPGPRIPRESRNPGAFLDYD